MIDFYKTWLICFLVIGIVSVFGFLLSSIIKNKEIKNKPSSSTGYNQIETTKSITILDERTGQRWVVVRQGENLTLEKYYPDIKDIKIE